jgi:hypothetical protein
MQLLNLLSLTQEPISFDANANGEAVSADKLSVIAAEVVLEVDTPVGGTATLQKSMGVGLPADWVWLAEGSAQNITVDGAISFSKVDPEMKYYRIAFELDSGDVTAQVSWLGKGYT